jgi:type IV pilus assembly protein PilP
VYLKRIQNIIFFLTVFFIIPGLQAMNVFAVEEKVVEGKVVEEKAVEGKAAAEVEELKFTEKMAAILFQEADDPFIYQREGRTDPFEKFIRERLTVSKAPVEELTGMRKFEPGQLTVVAIVMGATDKFAMMQDSNNQGYIIREGILLGRTGVVEAIVPNKVIVKNYTYNLAGDKIYKTVEMVLNREGEK